MSLLLHVDSPPEASFDLKIFGFHTNLDNTDSNSTDEENIQMVYAKTTWSFRVSFQENKNYL